MDAQGLLGPLPSPWRAHFTQDTSTGAFVPRYLNGLTSVLSVDDPRLGSLPDGWTLFDDGRFHHMESRRITDQDPRWQLEALEARGVDLQNFHLV